MEAIKNAISLILKHIGEDTTRDGLTLTPERVLESYNNIFLGYNQIASEIITEKLGNAEKNDIILFEKIDFSSYKELIHNEVKMRIGVLLKNNQL